MWSTSKRGIRQRAKADSSLNEAIHKQKELESKIDSLVYTLYNLTDDEIATIEKD